MYSFTCCASECDIFRYPGGYFRSRVSAHKCFNFNMINRTEYQKFVFTDFDSRWMIAILYLLLNFEADARTNKVVDPRKCATENPRTTVKCHIN